MTTPSTHSAAAARMLIRGGHVVTMDPTLGTITDGEVLVEGGVIIAVGRHLGVTDAEVLDARGKIVAPGLVDAHRHSWQTQLRGCCSNLSLAEYLFGFWGDAVSSYTADDARLGVLAGTLESLDSGVTTVYDFSHITNSPAYADASVDALAETGIRAVYSYGLGQVDPMGPPDFDRMADAVRLAGQRFSSPGLLTMGIGLSEIGLVPISTTRAEKRLADELGAVSAAHIGPNWEMPTGVTELAAAGVLDDRLICAHVSTPSPEEWKVLGAAGVKVASTPETELNLGAKGPTIRAMLTHDLKPSIGSDIAPLTSADVLANTRLALSFTRWADAEPSNRLRHDLDSVSITAAEALEWATLNGAAALGLGDRVGSLTAGKQADLIVVGGAHLGGRPVNDPVGQLVFQTTPSQIELVMVAGTILKRDGRLVGVDVDAVLARLEESSRAVQARMAERASAKKPPAPGVLEAMPAWVAANLAS